MLLLEKNKLIHETQIRVTYKDTDRMGYSYYGNYPTYFEIGRTEFLRELGMSYKILEDRGYLLPISKMTVKYIKPAIYDDLLTVRTIRHENDSKIRIEFDYEIFNSDNELINKGYTMLIFINATTRRPVEIPEFYTNLIDNYLNILQNQKSDKNKIL